MHTRTIGKFIQKISTYVAAIFRSFRDTPPSRVQSDKIPIDPLEVANKTRGKGYMGSFKTYFVRHTAGVTIDDATRRRIWDEGRIAIHYLDKASLDPNDYGGGGPQAVSTLKELARDGGYVYAEHHGYDQIQVGFVPPGSNIEILEGTWASNSEHPGRPALLKTLSLQRVKYLSPSIATDRHRIWAQVTFSPLEQAMHKLERLRVYYGPDKPHLILFCDVQRPTVEKGVMVFPLQIAFDYFTATELGKVWLELAVRGYTPT